MAHGGHHIDDISTRLEAIEYLARSANRVHVLTVLGEDAIDRRDLREDTGFSRATLSRTLGEFERRGWIETAGDAIRLTALGSFVAREFERLLDRMGVVDDLRDVIQWFPEGGYGFDLSLLGSATIVRPRKEDALAPMNNLVSRLTAADSVRILSYSLLPDTLETCWRRAIDGQQTVEFVLEPAVFDVIRRHPTMTEQMCDLIELDDARILTYEGSIPFVVVLADDVVNLCLSDGVGAPHAMIDTEEMEIRRWARETIETYRRAALPVESERVRSRSS